MSIPVALQSFKSAGVYRVVYDKSTIAGQDTQIMRLVVGYSAQGPFNTPVLVNTVSEFKALYGGISKSLEKKGVYFHRLALQALTSGPILCLNLKKFDGETVQGADVNTDFNPDFTPIDTVELSVEDIYDTSRFWELSAFKLADISDTSGKSLDGYITLSATNTKNTSVSFFLRKASGSKVSGYNVTVNDWYNDASEEVPDYLQDKLNNKMSDFFAEIYIFKGKFTADQVLASETLKNYFVSDKNGGIKLRPYVLNAYGEPTDTLEALYNDSTSGALSHYTGCLIPYFTDKQGSYQALDILVNNDVDTNNLMMNFDVDALEDGTANIDLSGRCAISSNLTKGLSLEKIYTGVATSTLLGNISAPVVADTLTFAVDYTTMVNTEPTDKTIAKRLQGNFYVKSIDITNIQSENGQIDTSITDKYALLSVVDMKDDISSSAIKEFTIKVNGANFNAAMKKFNITVNETEKDGKYTYTFSGGIYKESINLNKLVYPANNISVITNYTAEYSSDVEAAYEAAQADTKAKKTIYDTAIETEATTKDAYDTAVKTETTDKDAYDTAVKTEAIAKTTYDTTVSVETALKAEYETAKSDREIKKAALDGAQAAYDTDQTDETKAALDEAQAAYDKAVNTEASKKVAYETAQANTTTAKTAYETAQADTATKKATYDVDQANTTTAKTAYETAQADTATKKDAYDTAVKTEAEALQKRNTSITAITFDSKTGFYLISCDILSKSTVLNSVENVWGSSVTFITMGEYNIVDDYDGSVALTSTNDSSLVGVFSEGDCLLAADADDDGYYDNVYVQEVGSEVDGTTTTYYVKLTGTPMTYDKDTSGLPYIIRIDSSLNQEIGNMSPVYLEGYTYANPKPTSTSMYDKQKWQDFILSALTDYKGLRTGLLNKADIDYRYIIDTFETYVTSGAKSVLSYLCREKQSAFAILNFPAVRTFVKCPYTSFTDANGIFNVNYVVKGYNPKKMHSTTFNLPSESEGASFCAFYTPLKFSDGYIDSIIPSAALVSNLFIEKYNSRQPYYIVAGPNYGAISASGMTGPDYNYSRDELNVIEPFGVNCMVYRPTFGTFINANQTAKQTPVSALSSVNVRELVIYLQDEIEKVLQSYQWEFNNQTVRNKIKDRADVICTRIMQNGGIQDFVNVMDETNNTAEIIDNEMAVLSTHIEPGRGMGKMVHELTLYRTGQMRSSISEA
jgi:hypothetical protein